MQVGPEDLTSPVPEFEYGFDCSKADELRALEVTVGYRIARKEYRLLGTFLGLVFMFPLISTPASTATVLFFLVGAITISWLALWPSVLWLKTFFSGTAPARYAVEITSSGVASSSEGLEPVRYPWLSFSGLVRNKHGICLFFGKSNPGVWIPIRAFENSEDVANAERFVQASVSRFRSMLKRQ